MVLIQLLLLHEDLNCNLISQVGFGKCLVSFLGDSGASRRFQEGDTLGGVQRQKSLGSILGKARGMECDWRPALRKGKTKTNSSTEYQVSENHPYVIVLMRVL